MVIHDFFLLCPPFAVGLCVLCLENLYSPLQIWCWSCHNGCALLKMSALPKEQDDSILQVQKSFLDGSVLVNILLLFSSVLVF